MRTGRSGRQVPHSLRAADVRPAPRLDSEGFWTLKIAFTTALPTFTLTNEMCTIHRTIKNKVPHFRTVNLVPVESGQSYSVRARCCTGRHALRLGCVTRNIIYARGKRSVTRACRDMNELG